MGLLRIEQLYFARPMPPTEDELFSELKSLIAPLGDRPVTIRLLDIGGDKPLPYLGLPATSNPVLGRRGVRLLLNYAQLVRTQIGAILKLSQKHSLRVLIPMVTLEDDIRRMRETFNAISRSERSPSRPIWRDGRDTGRGLGNSRALEARRFFLRRHKRPHPIHLWPPPATMRRSTTTISIVTNR